MFIRKRCTLTATLIYSLMIIALVSCGGGNGGAGPAKETSINQWVWMTGSKVVNQATVYGTKGIASDTNTPGARRGSSSWVDKSDNLWLFGGTGYNSAGVLSGTFNDLWKFDGGKWTWISGSSVAQQSGNYGTKGVAVGSNVPGARWGAASWIDSNNNLWLFGGEGYDSTNSFGYLNDLWKFNGINWTWVSGSNLVIQTGIYGTEGLANSANIPGARFFTTNWIDSNNTLWLFGGHGRDSNAAVGRLNDLWKFDGANWTWVSGSELRSQAGVYGTKNVTADSNMPGARYTSNSWIDGSNNLWLFGGNGHDINGFMSLLNDLWKFDGTRWTWISGGNTFGHQGVYGTKGEAATTNIPGCRDESISWIDSRGDFWLFGGYGKDSSGSSGILNDLWKFDGVNWTWVSGVDGLNEAGLYGVKAGLTDGNLPGGRVSISSWIDKNNYLWLFGGAGYDSDGTYGLLNDLWRYQQ